MRITRVYTKTGDRGTTRLVGGVEVRKDDARIEAYGTVDELNAVLGIVRTFLGDEGARLPDAVATIDGMLGVIQNDLFNVGADLATRPSDRWPGMFRVEEPDVLKLEGWIDQLNDALPPLQEFILPGGGKVGAFLHQARTVARRAERRVVSLLAVEPEAGEGVLRYLNRLSDLLFVLGRHTARALGEPEVYWKKPTA
jgi:cob(I)alamin adenosyltransferase